MSTRCVIGLKDNLGDYEVIYCHWDGYLEWTGRILFDSYQNVDKIKELLSFGDLSILGANISPKGQHSFMEPEEDCCVFYGRDREEEDVKSRHIKTLEGLASMAWDCGAEYIYIYDTLKGCWEYSTDGKKFYKLKKQKESA